MIWNEQIKMKKDKEYLEDLELRKWWYNHY